MKKAMGCEGGIVGGGKFGRVSERGREREYNQYIFKEGRVYVMECPSVDLETFREAVDIVYRLLRISPERESEGAEKM